MILVSLQGPGAESYTFSMQNGECYTFNIQDDYGDGMGGASYGSCDVDGQVVFTVNGIEMASG